MAKETGKGLSTVNYTEEDANTVSDLRTSGWVRPVEGKDLSDVNFTSVLATKLNGIQEGATKTDITQTLSESETTVPSNKAVSTGLSAKVAKTDIVSEIDSSNSSALDKVPSVKAVADYVDSNISGAMDFAVVKGDTTLSISNETDGLCAVRITKMSDGTTQYQSNVNSLGDLGNKTTAFTFNITASANYMIEAWIYNSSTSKLVPAAVKFI